MDCADIPPIMCKDEFIYFATDNTDLSGDTDDGKTHSMALLQQYNNIYNLALLNNTKSKNDCDKKQMTAKTVPLQI